MAAALKDSQIKLLKDKNFASVATVGEDGGPQVTPVWIEWDGTHVTFNTEKKRAKFRNLSKDPRVAISVFDMANPYNYIEIRGRVVDITEEGAADDIDRLMKKYTGQEKYAWHQPGDVRVIVKVQPEKVMGR